MMNDATDDGGTRTASTSIPQRQALTATLARRPSAADPGASRAAAFRRSWRTCRTSRIPITS